MNLLIVDDEVLVVSLLLKNINWSSIGIDKVFHAYNAISAKKIMDNESIQIIVSDIEMPQEDGLHLLEWVQKNHPGIAKLILTGFPDFKFAQDAIELGVLKYMVKPVRFEELQEAIKQTVQMFSSMQERYFIHTGARFSSDANSEDFIGEIKRYIEQHYSEEISRQDIERLVHLNDDYINRAFKSSTGYSLIQYIQYYRILVSKDMLAEGVYSIAEISSRVGFDSSSYFAKIFRKWTEMTPAEYQHYIREKSDTVK